MAVFDPTSLIPRLQQFADAQVAWIAYSGGMDSTVLLHALVEIRDRLGFALRAVHVDHGLHPDSYAWAEHCTGICEGLGLSCQVRRVEVVAVRGESLEALARQTRYQAMVDVLQHGDLLLTAQHRDDQAETLLLALMRGSGPKGLAAMPTVAPLGAGRLVRPLLAYSRAGLLDYAKRRGLDWLEDPGNQDLGFDRNFLRHRVLPLLAERWPACTTSIARSAAHCAEAQGLVDRIAQDALSMTRGQGSGALSIERLLKLDLPLRKAVLRCWFPEQGRAAPDSRHLERILTEVLAARPDANPLVTWPGCEVRRYRDDLFAIAPLPPAPGAAPIRWATGSFSLPSGLGRLELAATDGQDLDVQSLFPDGLAVRFAVQGLWCRPARDRHRRALSKLFQESGLPPWVRPYVPLIFAKDELIAVGDICVCQSDGAAVERGFRVRWRPDQRGWNPRDLLMPNSGRQR